LQKTSRAARTGRYAAPQGLSLPGSCPNYDALRDLPPAASILAMFLEGDAIVIKVREVGG
jgi:hypothetical protein